MIPVHGTHYGTQEVLSDGHLVVHEEQGNKLQAEVACIFHSEIEWSSRFIEKRGNGKKKRGSVAYLTVCCFEP